MTYKLRAEVASDVVQFIESQYHRMTRFLMIKDEDFPDVTFEFDTDMSIDDIILELHNIEDSHVMYQTVKPIEEYDGKRDYELQ